MARYGIYKKTTQRWKPIVRKEVGFSLIDLLFTLVLMSVLLSLAFPVYKHLILEIRLSALTERITSAMDYARSEAIRHRELVILCHSKDGKTCSGEWRDGWIIFYGNYTQEPLANSLLHIYPSLNKNEYLEWHGAFKRKYVQLNYDGSAYGHNGSFIVCVKVLSTTSAWRVVLSPTGRMRVDREGNRFNCHF